jgi:hypothetical protein
MVVQQGAFATLTFVHLIPPVGRVALSVSLGGVVHFGTGGEPIGEAIAPDMTVLARSGGRIVTRGPGAPTLGRAVGNDWDVGNGFPQNKAFFSAADISLSHDDGSMIVRDA